MQTIIEMLRQAIQEEISDIFIVSGRPLSLKKSGKIYPAGDEILKPDTTRKLLEEIYALNQNRDMTGLMHSGDDDFSFSIEGVGRFRCNAYKQRGSLAAVLRVVAFELPDYSKLNIPETIINLHKKNKGLVLVTGPAGSGKSTTLSCMINQINLTRNNHIITIEDPIEFLHKHHKSIVSQREVEHDTKSYVHALRAALRQSPNVILLGEMRDLETISTAMTAAETGQLVLSTLHTIGAANTIDRIIDVFPSNQQQQIRIQLSMVLQAVVSQELLPSISGGVIPAFEVMLVNSAIRNMIRESKVHQIDNVIFSSAGEGMVSLDADILRLYKEGRITKESALTFCVNQDLLSRKLF